MSARQTDSKSTETGNEARLRRLRKAIDDENPVDGIHNPEVASLYAEGGECPRILGCASEGHWDSGYRDNPDFLAGDSEDIADWLASCYGEGWAGRWVLDLDVGEHVGWTTTVALDGGPNGR
jgi:hypothetical protein